MHTSASDQHSFPFEAEPLTTGVDCGILRIVVSFGRTSEHFTHVWRGHGGEGWLAGSIVEAVVDGAAFQTEQTDSWYLYNLTTRAES